MAAMTDCYCGYDPPLFSRRKIVTARKEHRCEECRVTILHGERYEIVIGKWGTSIDEFKTCSRCLAVRQYVTDHVPCFCWAHGNMRDDARETIDEYWPELPGLWFGWGRLEIAVRQAAKR